jgi:hypothetical protein
MFKFSEKIDLELIPIRIGRIRIGMPWMPIPSRIWKNNADPIPSLSGSTTLLITEENS